MSDFQSELRTLINRHSVESHNNTPDFILARYLAACMSAFTQAVYDREQWYGYEMVPGRGPVSLRPGAVERQPSTAPQPGTPKEGKTE